MDTSLTSGWVPVAVPVLAALALAGGVDWRDRGALRSFAGAVVLALLLTGGAWWAQTRWQVVPAGFSFAMYGWIALLALAVCSAVVAVTHRRARATAEPDEGPPPAAGTRRRTGRRLRCAAALVAVPLALASTAVALNVEFQYYPTLSSLRGDSAIGSAGVDTLDRLRRSADPTDDTQHVTSRYASALPNGLLVSVDIPGPVSHFSARTAWVWVPPLYVAGLVQHVPVVMLLAGTPGQTSDWLRGGGAADTAARFAAAHDGASPMLVMPDPNGSATADTECVDHGDSRAETYLTQDVPAFMAARFGATTTRSWAVAGLSEGGMCSAMLALRHPDLFAAFADFSGLTSPTLTDRIDRRATARDLFEGNLGEYDRHDPLWLLANHPPLSVHGFWQVGADDPVSRTAQRSLVARARASGLPTDAVETPGARHNFTFWTIAFAETLPKLTAVLDAGPGGGTATTVGGTPPVTATTPGAGSPRASHSR